MTKDVFIFQGNVYSKADVENITVKQLMDGPYLIRYSSDAFGNFYFAGMDVALQQDLISKGKLYLGVYRLIDTMVDFLHSRGVDDSWTSTVDNKTCKELLGKIYLEQRWTPQKVTVISSAVLNTPDEVVMNDSDKFNKLLS